MKVTNKSQAKQGVWFSGELKWIAPGDSAEGDMTEAEAKLLEGNDNLDVSGKANKAAASAPAA
jgi:hypothetical protein